MSKTESQYERHTKLCEELATLARDRLCDSHSKAAYNYCERIQKIIRFEDMVFGVGGVPRICTIIRNTELHDKKFRHQEYRDSFTKAVLETAQAIMNHFKGNERTQARRNLTSLYSDLLTQWGIEGHNNTLMVQELRHVFDTFK